MKNTLLLFSLLSFSCFSSFAQIDSLQSELYKFSLDKLTETEENQTGISVASNISTDENKQPAVVGVPTNDIVQNQKK